MPLEFIALRLQLPRTLDLFRPGCPIRTHGAHPAAPTASASGQPASRLSPWEPKKYILTHNSKLVPGHPPGYAFAPTKSPLSQQRRGIRMSLSAPAPDTRIAIRHPRHRMSMRWPRSLVEQADGSTSQSTHLPTPPHLPVHPLVSQPASHPASLPPSKRAREPALQLARSPACKLAH